jgi:hypothetical protein
MQSIKVTRCPDCGHCPSVAEHPQSLFDSLCMLLPVGGCVVGLLLLSKNLHSHSGRDFAS